MKKTNMKRTLSTLLILTAILLVGCDRKTSSSLAKPPIAIDVIAPAVANQMTGEFAERFVRVGGVRFDESADKYSVEVFYRSDEQERREVVAFSRQPDVDRPGLIVFGAMFNLGIVDKLGRKENINITIDNMMGAKDTSQQDGGRHPATRPDSK